MTCLKLRELVAHSFAIWVRGGHHKNPNNNGRDHLVGRLISELRDLLMLHFFEGAAERFAAEFVGEESL